MMRICALQHDPIVGIGAIENWLLKNNLDIQITRVDLGEPFPDIGNFDLLIILGGRMGAYEEERYPWIKQEKEYICQVSQANKYILGICLGCQLISGAFGGRVYKNTEPELGWNPVEFEKSAVSHPLLENVPLHSTFFEYHFDTFTLPVHASLIANNSCSYQGFTVGEHILALQFHPEFNEEMVLYMKENIYPKDGEGRHIQTISGILEESNFEESRKWLFQIMNNFKKQILCYTS